MSRPVSTAVLVDGYGGPDQVRTAESPRPSPGPNEVLIQVVASGISHMDAYIREGRFQDAIPLTFPARQGCSFAGIVREVGSAVTSLKRGVEVLGHDPAHGAHATHIVVDAGAVVRRPPRLGWEVAGALYLVGLTAFRLIAPLRLSSADTVLVSAAAGGVGHLEVQLARLAGAHVVGIAGRENHDYLRSIGAVPVTYGADIASAVRKAAEGRQITALLDNYGNYEGLAAEVGVPQERMITSDDRRRTEIALYQAGGDPTAATQLRDMAELVSAWNVRVLVSGFYGFADIGKALAELDARHSRGVVVVGMRTTAPSATYLGGTMRAHHEAASSALAP